MMRKIVLIAILLCLVSFNFASETGQYRYYEYGVDFNLSEFVVDINGVLDTDFSSDCNITAKYLPTSTLVLGNNTFWMTQ